MTAVVIDGFCMGVLLCACLIVANGTDGCRVVVVGTRWVPPENRG